MTLTLHPEVGALLGHVDHDISKALLDKKLEVSTINYISMDKDGKFSYLNPKKLAKDRYNDVWKNTLRQSTTLGRLIKKIFPMEKYSDDDVRTFVEKVKTVNSQGRELKVVEGAEAIYNYFKLKVTVAGECARTVRPGTKLYSSCFQGKRPESDFKFFEENLGKVQLAVVLLGGKLEARMFIWHGEIDDKPVKCGDNIQYGAPESKEMLINFCKENEIMVYDEAPTERVKFRSPMKYVPTFPYFDYFMLHDINKTKGTALLKGR